MKPTESPCRALARGLPDWDEYERTEFEKQYRSFASLGDDALWAAVESSVYWNRMYREVMEDQRAEIRTKLFARPITQAMRPMKTCFRCGATYGGDSIGCSPCL